LRGAAEEALADGREALRLEPNALAARQLELEALIAWGDTRGAARALEVLDRETARLRGYDPLNGYESFLMRVNGRDLEKARGMIASLLLLVPDADLLGGGHDGDGRRRLLGEDLIEERLLRLGLPPRLAVPVVVPVHAGLADDRLDLAVGQRLDGVIQDQLATRAVVVDSVAEAHRPLDHRITP
jgi:hypothetical protein